MKKKRMSFFNVLNWRMFVLYISFKRYSHQWSEIIQCQEITLGAFSVWWKWHVGWIKLNKNKILQLFISHIVVLQVNSKALYVELTKLFWTKFSNYCRGGGQGIVLPSAITPESRHITAIPNILPFRECFPRMILQDLLLSLYKIRQQLPASHGSWDFSSALSCGTGRNKVYCNKVYCTLPLGTQDANNIIFLYCKCVDATKLYYTPGPTHMIGWRTNIPVNFQVSPTLLSSFNNPGINGMLNHREGPTLGLCDDLPKPGFMKKVGWCRGLLSQIHVLPAKLGLGNLCFHSWWAPRAAIIPPILAALSAPSPQPLPIPLGRTSQIFRMHTASCNPQHWASNLTTTSPAKEATFIFSTG